MSIRSISKTAAQTRRLTPVRAVNQLSNMKMPERERDMGYLLFGFAIIDGFLAYKTGSLYLGFVSGFMLGLGIGYLFIQAYKGIIQEMLK